MRDSKQGKFSICATTIQPNWRDLLPELLVLILKKLPSAADIIRFSAVCPCWNSAAKSTEYTWLSQQEAWIMQDDNWGISSPRLFSFKEKRTFSIGHKPIENTIDLGCSHGWLVLSQFNKYDPSTSMYLFNPVSGARVHLPAISCALPDHFPPFRKVWKATISADPSRSDKFMVAVVLVDGTVAFLKSNNEDKSISMWSVIGCSTIAMKFSPVLYSNCAMKFEDDQLFVVSNIHIAVWNFEGGNPQKTMDFGIPLPLPEAYVHFTPYAGSPGDILLITQHPWPQFTVYKLNFTLRQWERVETLSGRAILLYGPTMLLSNSAGNFPEFKENSIYHLEINASKHVVRVLQFNMGDKSTNLYSEFEYHYPRIQGIQGHPSIRWIVPNPVMPGEAPGIKHTAGQPRVKIEANQP